MGSLNKDAYLKKPEFGVLPEHVRGGPSKLGHFEFEPLLEMCRERPGEDACIATFTKGGKKQTYQDCRGQVARLWKYLRMYRPLEEWEIHSRTKPETWADREIWVCFIGLMTPEEAERQSEERKWVYSKKVYAGVEKKAEREARAKARAIMLEQRERRRRAAVG